MTAPRAVAIVGSRKFPRLDLVRNFVRTLPPDTIVVSGGAVGVDLAAEREAKARGLDVVTFRPDYAKHGKAAPLIRNAAIAEYADELVAFWDGTSRGTAHVMSCAKGLNVPVRVVTP